MSICIVDFQPGGHHRFYIQQIVDLPCVTAFVGHEDLADLFGERRELMAVTTVNKILPNQSERLKLLKQHLKTHTKPDEFFLMEADQLSKLLLSCAILSKAAISGIPVGGIWFRSNFFYRKGLVASAKRRISIHLLTAWSRSRQRLFFLDDLLARQVALRCGVDEDFFWCREPYDVDLKPGGLDSSKAEGSVGLLFIGSQAKRKGTAWAIRALVGAQFSRQITIHIAGVIYDKDIFVAIELARDAGIDVVVDNRFLDSSEYDAAFKQCSIVMLPYCDFGGSSGVLIEAAQYQKPVIAPNYGTLGRIVQSSKWGDTFKAGDLKSFHASVIRTIIHLPVSNAGFLKILNRCSSKAFIATVKGNFHV